MASASASTLPAGAAHFFPPHAQSFHHTATLICPVWRSGGSTSWLQCSELERGHDGAAEETQTQTEIHTETGTAATDTADEQRGSPKPAPSEPSGGAALQTAEAFDTDEDDREAEGIPGGCGALPPLPLICS